MPVGAIVWTLPVFRRAAVVGSALWLTACSSADFGTEASAHTEVEPSENWSRDVIATDLDVNVDTRLAAATLTVGSASLPGVSFEVAGLEISQVRGADGLPLRYRVADGRLDVGIPKERPAEVTVEYSFREQEGFQGASSAGLTFLWPYHCGNLFPCKSDPADGTSFTLALSGLTGGTAVYPQAIEADAPSYMVAWAIGDYTRLELGTTEAGTTVSVYYLPDEQALAQQGTTGLAEAFDWLEQTYGAYLFGSDVGSVSAPWGPGAYGGMEHHPYWHVSHRSMGDVETHVHEAAHGWFGNGVRIACWEDLTLSEGVTSYLTARGIEAVAGEDEAAAVWSDYDSRLDWVIRTEDRLAWPDSCGEIDVVTDLWNAVPYMKGAFFVRAVEDEVGRGALDHALARFYQEHKGKAAGMQQLLDAVREHTGFDPHDLAHGWLRSLGRPDR